ncbi:hypothetical protein CPB83DRAFT_898225 [Crepidotus variabilis]|uniref:Uncharacterized protein n=1 Tax=Crepidotus variabilis TaxID=179855 RepID=A0A9P6E7H7_9AGAR|nr:hypothetical protein CPB83DRAFT_898225 [Crepidotus variabilis]
MQSFRASPWVSYDPSANAPHTRDPHVSGSEMDDDADMEAPQISILRTEDTPPPVHRKAATNPKKRPAASMATSTESRGRKEEAEDEEDQLVDELIDDDSVDLSKGASRSTGDAGQKRKAPAKKKARKEKKHGEVDKKGKDKTTPSEGGGHTIAPTLSMFKANPAEYGEDGDSPSSIGVGTDLPTPKSKKKTSPRKPPATARAKAPAKATKQKTALPNLIVEDVGTLSESYAGTAASSPVTGTFEPNTPEPEVLPPSSPPASVAPLPEEPPNLENVPIPIYPLPTKPFPVQQPPKIPAGSAPLIPLEKSGKKVRHWREANREIRGIAGGRWLVKTWVGEKESDLAAHLSSQALASAKGDDKASAVGLSLPKLPALSAPIKKSVSKLKGSSKGGSAATSANPSRAPSVVPDAPIALPSSMVKAPSKMRISQQAPSEAGDSVADGSVGI